MEHEHGVLWDEIVFCDDPMTLRRVVAEDAPPPAEATLTLWSTAHGVRDWLQAQDPEAAEPPPPTEPTPGP